MTTEAEVRAILRDPFIGGRRWTIQGLGMLRTYLDPEEVERLHIWDTDLAFPAVSTMHDHPWDFDSRVVSGHLHNERFHIYEDARGTKPFYRSTIKCGEGGGLIGKPEIVQVASNGVENIDTGETYHQDAPELHETYPSRGAVTIIRREFRSQRDIATVLWESGEWGTAEPRPASTAEVMSFIEIARNNWTGDIAWTES